MAKKAAPPSTDAAAKAARVKAAAAVKKLRQATQQTLAVPTAVVGGFRVYGSPVRPVHFTQKQIADAVAALE